MQIAIYEIIYWSTIMVLFTRNYSILYIIIEEKDEYFKLYKYTIIVSHFQTFKGQES